MAEQTFQWKHLPSLFKETFKEWNADDPWRQSAVVAYYAIFSLPALLMIIVTIAGSMFGQEAVQGKLSGEISDMIGPNAAEGVETMISNAYQQENSIWMTIIGVAILLFGATGVFYQLQQSLNIVWDVEPKEDSGIKKLVKDRVSSFGVILVIGFLLLISLMLTTVLSILSDFIQEYLPSYLLYVFYIVNFVVSLGIISLLFAMIYKILPDVEIQWRTVWVGAIVTGVLFVLGKFGLGIYFGNADPASAYGAAGSVILILLWVSYSCLILFFGAEFTQVYARRYGHPMEPSAHARRTPAAASKYEKEERQRNPDKSTKDRPAVSKKEASSDRQPKENGAGAEPEIIRVQRKSRP
jgi:membrane protein